MSAAALRTKYAVRHTASARKCIQRRSTACSPFEEQAVVQRLNMNSVVQQDGLT